VQGGDAHRAADQEGDRKVTVAPNFSATELSGPRFAFWFDIGDRLIGGLLDWLFAQSHWATSLDGFTNAVGVK
jgi:hypothetical protein